MREQTSNTPADCDRYRSVDFPARPPRRWTLRLRASAECRIPTLEALPGQAPRSHTCESDDLRDLGFVFRALATPLES
jgi:hypothetical protein